MNKGGKMIDSGGYGCVFYPALLCKNKTTRRNGVSKLMMKDNATKEYKIIKNITNKIKKIPNYKDYFIGPEIQKCIPNTLTQGDKSDMNDCEPLEKNDINKDNINKKLHKLMSLDFQYGGETFEKIIETINTKEEIRLLLKSMYNLLKYGIIPMNELNIIHGDIKHSNILVNKSNNGYQCKIIDWGLSYTTNDNRQCGRPLQFNVPFSSVLLRKNIDKYIEYFIDNKGNKSISTCKELAENILENEIASDDNHFIFYSNLYKNIFSNNTHDSKNLFIKYLSAILHKYIVYEGDGAVFKKDEYFNEIYIHNVDIWGFLSCFAYYNANTKSSIYKKEIIKLLKQFLFNEKYATKKIPISELLSKIFSKKSNSKHSHTIKKR
jgi:serine/threonine protein kinase